MHLCLFVNITKIFSKQIPICTQSSCSRKRGFWEPRGFASTLHGRPQSWQRGQRCLKQGRREPPTEGLRRPQIMLLGALSFSGLVSKQLWYVHASHARFPGSFTQQPWSPVDPSGGMANLFPVPAIKLMCPRGAEAGQLCQKPLRYPLLRLRVPTPCFSAGWHTPMWPGSAYTECVLTIFFFCCFIKRLK